MGNYFLSHLEKSIAHNLGLSDWVTTDKSDHIAEAINFASDLDALDKLRRDLRERLLQTPLFDAKTFACHFGWAVWEISRSIDQD